MASIRYSTVSVNGIPTSTEADLKTMLTSLISDREHLDEIAKDVWNGQFNAEPSGPLEKWIDDEPIVLASIDYLPISNPDALIVAPSISELENVPTSEIISRAVAGVLMMGNVSNHFIYTEDGKISINAHNPPSVQNAEEMVRRTLEIKETGDKLENFSLWTLGMLIHEFETYFQDAFDITNVCDATNKSYNTIVTCVGVYRAWGNNKRKISYTHHKEVHYAKISEELKGFVLDMSEKLQLSVAEQRKLVSYVKLFGKGIFENFEPATAEEMKEHIEGRAVNKNWIFLYLGEWHYYRGPMERIPNGATPIFDATKMYRIVSPDDIRPLVTWDAGYGPIPTEEQVVIEVEDVPLESPPPPPVLTVTIEVEQINPVDTAPIDWDDDLI